MELFDIVGRPDFEAPVLIVGLEGWIDAGASAAHAAEHMLGQLDTSVVARFDTDELLDYRARRPTMHLVDGVNTSLSWPATQLLAARAPNGAELLFLSGAEPDRAWRRFAREVRDLAVELGTRRVVGLGAYPAAVPHTRPPLLSITAGTDELASNYSYQRGTLEVPAGMEAALERAFTDAGVPALGLWAQVPHYVSAMRYPAASLALVEAVNQIAGADLATMALTESAARTRQRIDSLIDNNPEHRAMLAQLEEQFDEAIAAGNSPLGGTLPSGDELAAEFEQFLRDQDDH